MGMKPKKNLRIRSLSVEELYALKKSNTPFTLIDVRTAKEVATSHLGGQHIPLDEVRARIDEIPTKGTVIVHCYHGRRSLDAIKQLIQLRHFEDIRNLEGGLYAYAKRIDNSLTLY